MKFSRQKGFTLVEMMVVTVVLGLLITIGLINLQAANIRAREASVRSNMHSFQTVVELYAAEHSGFYPAGVDNLLNDPTIGQQRLLLEMANPFTSQKGASNAYDNDSVVSKPPGIITYASEPNLASYAIYAYDNLLQRLRQNGHELILSNK